MCADPRPAPAPRPGAPVPAPGVITTVLGDIEPALLGFCHSHEHLGIAPGYPASVFSHQRIDDAEKSARELAAFYGAGGRAVVDAQPLGACRDALLLAKAAAESGVHVAASTGFHKMLFYPSYHWIYRLSAERLARLYLSELEEGMFLDADGESEPQKRCGARAALVKAALDSGPFPGHGQYAKCFEAASLAARTAGCALMVHIEKDSEPLRLAEFLESRGVPAEKTVFCHLDRAVADTGVHKELAARGVFLEYDTICRPRYHGDGREAEIIAELCAAGFSGRLLLSLDTTRSRLAAYGGAPGLCYIIEEFIPRLRRAGVTEAEINRFFVENPARAFTRPPRPPRKAPCAPAPAGPTGSCFADFA